MSTFNVYLKIKFSHPVDGEHNAMKILKKIKQALIEQAEHAGIAPEDTEAFTMSFKLSNKKNSVSIEHKFI